MLSDIVIVEYGGKVHGSQSHFVNNSMSLIVYYEVHLGQKEEVKKFDNFTKSHNITSTKIIIILY